MAIRNNTDTGWSYDDFVRETFNALNKSSHRKHCS
jgi:hypothetical protein